MAALPPVASSGRRNVTASATPGRDWGGVVPVRGGEIDDCSGYLLMFTTGPTGASDVGRPYDSAAGLPPTRSESFGLRITDPMEASLAYSGDTVFVASSSSWLAASTFSARPPGHTSPKHPPDLHLSGTEAGMLPRAGVRELLIYPAVDPREDVIMRPASSSTGPGARGGMTIVQSASRLGLGWRRVQVEKTAGSTTSFAW